MKRNWIIITLVVAAAAVIVLQQRKIYALKASAPDAIAPAPAIQSPRTAPPAHEPVTPHPAMRAAATAPVPAEPAPNLPPADPQPGLANIMKSVGSMMTNPAMKALIRQQSKFRLAREYTRLFTYLNLPPEQTEALSDILMDRQMVVIDSGLGFLAGGGSPEERAAKARDMKATRASYDKKIADLLGADDYEAFKQYEDAAPERQQVEMFKSSLVSLGEPLTDQQEYDLVNAMHAARVNSPDGAALYNQDEVPGPEMFSESGMATMLARMDRVGTAYESAATKILTPTQYAQYQKAREQQRAMNAMGLQMAAQMFRGSSNAVPEHGAVRAPPSP